MIMTERHAIPPMIQPIDDDLGFDIGLGYDSSYIFRGQEIIGADGSGDHLVWGSINYANDFGSPVELSLGAWYASLAADDFTELDLYGALEFELAEGLTASVGYLWYYFPQDGGSDTNEVYGTLGAEFGGVETGFYAGYDTAEDGWYLALTAGYSVKLSDSIALGFDAGLSYSLEYYTPGSGFNNVDLRLSLPIALTDNATFTPYIAGSIALEELEDIGVDDYLYGGASITVTF
ncbi:hypothetical protein BH23VER1_BH23VER1_11770 [soil metagenome]